MPYNQPLVSMGVPTYNAKQKILTRYNEKTHKIRLLVQDLVRGTKEVGPLYAPTCWKYLDTNELLAMPEKMIIKGVQWA